MKTKIIRQPAGITVNAQWYLLKLTALILICLIALAPFAFGRNEGSGDTSPDDTARSSLPGSYRILADDGLVSFPFELFHGDIRFRAEINHHEVHLLLDDGFMWDQLLFWGSPWIDSLGLEYDGHTTVGGGPQEEEEIASRTASGITLGFPGLEFTDQSAVVTSYSSGTSQMWRGSEGQVSATFFKHFVVNINFDNMLITLIEPEKFEYRGKGVEIPWKPMGFGPQAIPASLELADGRTVSLDLLMDLGLNSQLRVVTGGENNIILPQRTLPTSLGFNIQGIETLGYNGRISRINIGGYDINDVLVGFISEEHSDHAYSEAMIGLGLLSRFNLVFDYTRQRLFIEPNHTFADPFEDDMSGMTMRKGAGDYQEIVKIYADSPADDAGLKIGDKVTQINGKTAVQYDYWKLMPKMRQEGETITLKILQEDKEVEVSIKLRRLL